MSPETVIPCAISDRLAAEPQRVRGIDGEGWWRITVPGEDIEDHVGGMDALDQCLGAGGFHGVQPVREDSTEDLNHLAIAITDVL